MKKILFTSLLSLGALAAGGSNAQIVFQAEDYNNMNGVQAENTSDAGGGRNLGYLNSGDWATYNKVTLPCAGTYKVEYRVASVSNTGVLILDRAGGGLDYGQISIPNTGGYQTWQTISHNISLPAGEIAFGLNFKVANGDWNLNWFKVTPPSCIDPNVSRWSLDAQNSAFYFATTKKNTAGTDITENLTFNEMLGSVSHAGDLIFTVPLASLSTGVDIRNSRMLAMLFEAASLPKMHFTAKLDIAAINAMPAGSSMTQTVNGSLTIHAVTKALAMDVRIDKNAAGAVSVSARKPVLVNSADFDMNAGVESLRAIAGLSKIVETVPVYFKLFFNDNPAKAPVQTIATAPRAISGLFGSVDSMKTAALTWVDNSSDETAFLIRRKGADGRWISAGKALSNEVTFNDLLVPDGGLEYKVIAVNDSVPSLTSPLFPIGSMPGDATVGHGLFNTTEGCTGCHSNQGAGVFGGFDVRSFKYFTKYPQYSDSVQGLADFIKDRMPIACSGNTKCLDIASYLYSLRGATQATACNANDPVHYGVRSVRLLTSYEYGNSLKGLFTKSLAKDYSSAQLALADVKYDNLPSHIKVPVTEDRFQRYESNAAEISKWAVDNAALPFTCTSVQTDACATAFIDKFAKLAFRRPLTAEEKTQYTNIVKKSADGLRWAVQTAIQSPQFLYRSELGIKVSEARTKSWGTGAKYQQADQNAYVLDPFEYASSIAYMMTGAGPDAALLAAAERGDLEDAAKLNAEIDRLLDSAAGKEHMGRFAGLWFRTDDIVSATRTNEAAFTPEVKASMAQEIREIYKHAFYNNLPIGDIYTGNFTMLNSVLSSYYGIPGGGSNANQFSLVNTENVSRGGVIASGAYMAVNAHDGKTSPIKRAVHARQDVLCQVLPLPTALIDETGARKRAADEANAALLTGNLTTTQFYEMQTNAKGTVCADCHRSMINRLFAMDDFDHSGKLRPVQGGKVMQKALDKDGKETGNLVEVPMVNAGGALYNGSKSGPADLADMNFQFDTGMPGASFSGSKGFGKLVVSSSYESVNSCLISKTFRFATGFPISRSFQEVNKEGTFTDEQQNQFSCVANSLKSTLSSAGGTPRAVIEAIGQSTATRFRR